MLPHPGIDAPHPHGLPPVQHQVETIPISTPILILTSLQHRVGAQDLNHNSQVYNPQPRMGQGYEDQGYEGQGYEGQEYDLGKSRRGS